MRRSKLVYILFFTAIVLAYLMALYTLPPDASTLTKYNLTSSQARLLSLSVAIPVIIIWSLGLYGFLKISGYAQRIKKDRDGKGFMTLSTGLGILAFGFPLQAVASSISNHLTGKNPHLIPTCTIIVNYIFIAVMLFSFYYIYKGAKHLASNLKQAPKTTRFYLWNAAYIVLGLNFIFFTLSNPARREAVEGVERAVYYLPDWLIVNTVILPYLISWFLGFLSVYYLRLYRDKVPGVLYKKALTFISNGIGAVVLSFVVLRFLSSLTVFFSNQSLRGLLLILYLLLIVISIGYVLIAIGARKLRKIEEV